MSEGRRTSAIMVSVLLAWSGCFLLDNEILLLYTCLLSVRAILPRKTPIPTKKQYAILDNSKQTSMALPVYEGERTDSVFCWQGGMS